MNVSDSRVNLIQGSVIYMKKMSSSKRGFTLTEILIVTAIVVIVSAAAFAGVAITLSRARETQKNLKENNGDNFENAARSEVDAINKDAADFAEIPSYKPKDSEATEESSEDENSDEDTNGGGGDVDPKDTPTPLPTNTTKPSETSATTTAHNNGGGSGTVTATVNANASVGVRGLTNNSDGTTSMTLAYNGGNEITQVNVRKNDDDTYSLYIDSDANNPIGAVIGYEESNKWCATRQWLDLPENQWKKLENTYGFTRN